MKTYKIDNSKISEFTKRSNNRVFKILAITTVTMSVLMFSIIRQKEVSAELIYTMFLPLLFTTIIIGLNYLNNKKLTSLVAENLKIIIDENSIYLIELCKTKLLENKVSATKSEIIRAGLIILSKLTDKELVSSIKLVEKIRTGRPKK